MERTPLYAKQPILNTDLCTTGYELLFRPTQQLGVINGNAATASVFLNALTLYDPYLLDTSLSLYLNCTFDWLRSDIPLERENLVLEVLETVENTNELIPALTAAKERGFKIALDDFHLSLDTRALLSIADIVKVDVQSMSEGELQKLVRQLELTKGFNGQLLAEKVERYEEYELCKGLGFTLFQGYFFARPEVIEGVKLQSSIVSASNLLVELSKPEPSISELEDWLKKDVILTARILALVNNSHLSAGKEIESIRHAVVLLGLDRLAKVLSIVIMTELTEQPDELVRQAIVTAFAMENIAIEHQVLSPGLWFLIGFFSKLDVLFGLSFDDIFKQIPVAEEIKNSVQHRNTEAARFLSLVESLIIGDWDCLNGNEELEQIVFNCLLKAEQEYLTYCAS
ncbi:EAL and HDOD domain-containing protein [Reinekea blandensis]|uniref:Predicted signal transduction protein containing EAL and modified HD-GYP domains n=1 Tax=Reinekea blandensis MED297 TaxID=314283 RepID=A4BFK3_9GAMM|nr:HDOD domain-containing protein [Reinekea blandensis]EAR09098.1 predicted signal transduction protein containing EAL and modified HD-GYP domains [Reinekea sp. MED297] [Reinekea blandensis MED297]